MNPDIPGIPSPFEAASYYYGLPSKPALIARSSTELWVEPRGPEAYLMPKELRPVGPHALDCVWEPVVASAIEAYLGSQEVAWTSLDPARIGYAGGDSFPVVIWIGVIPGSLSGTKGIEVALGCRAILMENGILDVHVEIRSSKTTLEAKLYKPAWISDPTAQAIEPFATSLGLPICAADTPHVEGTSGLFFVDSKHPGKLFLLTARHILFHPDLTPNNDYVPRFTSEVTKKVLLLGDAALKARIKDIKSEISGKHIILEHLEARKLEAGGWGLDEDEVEAERVDVERREEDARKAILALKELLSTITRDWGSSADRTIGHVVRSPPLAFSVGPDRYTEDWAVVEIDPSCVNKANFVGNCIDLGTFDKFILWMYPHPANLTSFEYPLNRLLELLGTIPDDQMGKPDNKTLDHDNDPIMVIKRGGASGLTVGRLNTIRSVLRYYFKDQPGQSSREVAVYPCKLWSGPFSEAGDSGSVVIDGKGRVAGLLTGGAGTTELSDCSYVTSINFLVNRLQECGYNPNIFPTADNL